MKKFLLFALVMVCILPFFSYEAVAENSFDELKKIIREICGTDQCEVINLSLYIKDGEVVVIAPPDADKEKYTVELLDSLAEGQKSGEKFYDFISLGISKYNPTCLYWKEISINNKIIKICLVPGP